MELTNRSTRAIPILLRTSAAFCICSLLLGTAPARGAAPDLAWSTYLGGSLHDEITEIAADDAGNVWVTGFTRSLEDFPTVNGLPGVSEGNVDAFLTRFSADGSVGFSSRIPGLQDEAAWDLAVTPDVVHLVGTEVVSLEFVFAYSAWVARDGSDFAAGSFAAEERSQADHAVYAGGEVWVEGRWSQYDTGSDSGSFYAWLAPGSIVPADIHLFQSGLPTGPLAADAAGNVYVLDSISETGKGFQVQVTKLNRSLQVLGSAVFGGSGNEGTGGLFVDSAGNVWVTGTTSSSDLPLVDPIQPQLGGSQDAFLLKLDPSLEVVFSTYLGGSGVDEGQSITVDPAGTAYVAGVTRSGDFPVTGGVPRPCAATAASLCGPSDAFVASVGASGTLGWAVLLGGSGEETGIEVAAPEAGAVVVAGNTLSGDFPTVNAFQPTRPDPPPFLSQNGFVARLESANQPPDCSAAMASPSEVWPPNRRMVPISVVGITDPEGDAVKIEITAITHDEPTAGPASSGVGTSTAQVKAERNGGGDGRIYRVAFEATDPSGASCTGEVTVCVPHDRRRGGACDGRP